MTTFTIDGDNNITAFPTPEGHAGRAGSQSPGIHITEGTGEACGRLAGKPVGRNLERICRDRRVR